MSDKNVCANCSDNFTYGVGVGVVIMVLAWIIIHSLHNYLGTFETTDLLEKKLLNTIP